MKPSVLSDPKVSAITYFWKAFPNHNPTYRTSFLSTAIEFKIAPNLGVYHKILHSNDTYSVVRMKHSGSLCMQIYLYARQTFLPRTNSSCWVLSYLSTRVHVWATEDFSSRTVRIPKNNTQLVWMVVMVIKFKCSH